MKKTVKNILNRALILFAGLIYTHIACAQKYSESDLSELARYLETSYCPHEISVWTAGGASSLNYRPSFGKTVIGFGGAFGAGYTYLFHKNWSLSSGLEYAFYRQKVSFSGFSDAYDTYDMLNNPIVYHTRIDGYSEKQLAGLLNIPLTVTYRTAGRHQFYASAGLKLGFPVYGKYKSANTLLTASGYYTDCDQTEIWQNDLGYGTFNMEENTKGLNFNVLLMGTLETGAKWNIGTGTNLYTGVFADYGFNNMQKNGNPNRFVEYNRNNPAQPIMNSVFAAQNSKVSPLAFGVKVKIAFPVGCRDFLNDHKTYKAMQTADNEDYYDFIVPEIQPPVEPPPPAPAPVVVPVVIPADTIKAELPEKSQQPDLAAINALRAERLAYLEAARERREKYSQSVLSMRNIGNYNLGIVTLTAEQEAMLDDYVEVMTDNLQIVLDITGHACDLGTDEINMRIGQERADLAKDYLVENGIAPSRIQTFSKGKTEPIFPNRNEANRKKNRRLDIVIKK